MGSCSITAWVQLVQPFALAAIAAVGAWIAWKQMHIARVKLQHDLYDRRYAVFQAARALLTNVVMLGDATNEALRAFSIGTADATFLLGDDIVAYLKELHDHAARLHSIKAVVDNGPIPVGAERAEVVRKHSEHFAALLAQITILSEKFRPYLQLDKRQRQLRRYGSLWQKFRAPKRR
jgi:hypothetical protein